VGGGDRGEGGADDLGVEAVPTVLVLPDLEHLEAGRGGAADVPQQPGGR
jgi:hypothetical protein